MLVREKKIAPRHKLVGGQPTPKPQAMPYTFPAPVNGWVLNQGLASPPPASARVLDNWTCTTTGIAVRGGSTLHATLDDDVTRLFSYQSTAETFFGATATAIYNITSPASATVVPTPAVRGRTVGTYSTTMFGTAGGNFLIAVNGTDVGLYYNGTEWTALDNEAIFDLDYDGLTADFAVGETLTGGTSGATAEILAITPATATTGTLRLGAITSGPFQNDEAITSATGAAVANGASAAGSAITITNVATSALSYVWSYANRLFFIEKNTLKFWYLPAAAIGGAAASFSMAGVFKRGGSLLFGATWSSDSGAGLDDRFVLATTEGEVAVYQGIDPASDWTLVGVYDMPKPLGPNAHVNAGGDLLIATETGIIPITAAVQNDVAALSGSAVTQRIAPYWQRKARALSLESWEMAKVTQKNILIVTQPADTDEALLVVNLQTGAWSRWTGLANECIGLFNDQPYMGDSAGRVILLDNSGADRGTPYTCRYLGQFDPMGAPGMTKTATQANLTFQAGSPFAAQLRFKADFDEDASTAPSSAANFTVDAWDVGEWDVAVWDAGSSVAVASEWQAVGATGQYLAPELQITFGVTPTPEVELVAIDAQFYAGAAVT